MYNDVITLIAQVYAKDDIGNEVASETNKQVYCKVKSVRSAEYYQAAQQGLKPELVFVVHPYEYNDEKTANYNNVRYNILRTYQIDTENMELTCERAIG